MVTKKINDVPNNLKVRVENVSSPNPEKQENASKVILILMIGSVILLNYKYSKGKL